MGDSEYLWPIRFIHLIEDRIWKSIEVVHPQSVFVVWASLLIFNNQFNDPLELIQKRTRDHFVCAFGIKDRRVAKFSFGIRV